MYIRLTEFASYFSNNIFVLFWYSNPMDWGKIRSLVRLLGLIKFMINVNPHLLVWIEIFCQTRQTRDTLESIWAACQLVLRPENKPDQCFPVLDPKSYTQAWQARHAYDCARARAMIAESVHSSNEPQYVWSRSYRSGGRIVQSR